MSIIKKMLIRFLRPFTKQSIIFESIPIFSDNTKAVFDEMVDRKLYKKYYLVWWIRENRYTFYSKNKKFIEFDITSPKSLMGLLLYISIYDKPICGICCNQMLPRLSKTETLFYLGHGTNIKSTKAYYGISKDIDYYIAESEYFKPIVAREHRFDVNRTVALGYPRNDVFAKTSIKKIDMIKSYKKVIVWYPTYRQHKNGFKTTNSTIPIIHDDDSAIALNKLCIAQEILLVIKPHFAQDVSYIKNLHLSNIIFIDDQFFINHSITSYEFVASCDALLTDYSSIYYDFMLCDKPIGVIWEDIEDYKVFPGFAVDLSYVMQGAEKIFSLQQLQEFIIDVANDIDKLKMERQEICKIAHYSDDGKNSKRVVDFIIEKANL